MKSLDDLKKIKDETLKKIAIEKNHYRVTVGTATCGIAAGANPVFEELSTEIKKNKLNNVSLVQVGCIGRCTYEPLVEIINTNGEKFIYVNVNKEKAKEIVSSHLIKNEILNKYLMPEK